VIALLGNVFSPRRARVRDRGDDAGHWSAFCAVNVALEHRGVRRWIMTEHPRETVHRSAASLAIGRSSLRWTGDALEVVIDERSAPWRTRTRGRIRLCPAAMLQHTVALDGDGSHRWSPLAPAATVHAVFDEPWLRFDGHGYLDTNAGDGPLEEAFASWSWSRAIGRERTAIAYDVIARDGSAARRDLVVDRRGRLTAGDGGRRVELPRTAFGLRRPFHAPGDGGASLVSTLEDGPFYARSVVRTSLDGVSTLAMHEAVSLDRLRARWVRFLVPFRMRVERSAT